MRNISGLASICLLLAAPGVHAAQAAASITIDGKSTPLAHARAWHVGIVMGVPDIEVYFAEKDLAGMNWIAGYKNFETGQRGVVLMLHPSSARGEKSGQDSYHYVMDSTSFVSTYAENCGHWNEASLDGAASAKVTEFTLAKGVVTGKVDWQGKAECPGGDPPDIVTAWSASFSLPVEEVEKIPD
jgi:hypothetical protein